MSKVKGFYDDVEGFKAYVEGFMKHHDLRGMEMLLPYCEEQPVFRACGKGMVHPKGTPMEGVELWLGINSILNQEDRAEETIDNEYACDKIEHVEAKKVCGGAEISC